MSAVPLGDLSHRPERADDREDTETAAKRAENEHLEELDARQLAVEDAELVVVPRRRAALPHEVTVKPTVVVGAALAAATVGAKRPEAEHLLGAEFYVRIRLCCCDGEAPTVDLQELDEELGRVKVIKGRREEEGLQ